MRRYIESRVNRLEQKYGRKQDGQRIVRIVDYSKAVKLKSGAERLQQKTIEEPCPGCEQRISEARQKQAEAVTYITCPYDCPPLRDKPNENFTVETFERRMRRLGRL